MGVVRINTHNHHLENMANYSDLKSLKNLLKNLHNLRQLGEMGDMVAMAIYVDLKTAVYKPELLTDLQRSYIVLYYLDHYTLTDIASLYNIRHETVHESINSGLKKIQTALINGHIYRSDGDGSGI